MNAPSPTRAQKVASRLTGTHPDEAGIVLLSAAYFFFILSAYYVLRPIRDGMGVAGGVENIPWLFTATLAGMLVAHPVFASIVSRWPRKRFVTVTYRFFMLNLLVYYLLLTVLGEGTAAVWVGRTFFVWISVFNLFVVSVFWSFMTDIYRERQSRRLFGLIGVGGTVGGIVGSSITAFLVGVLSLPTLLWFSIVLLECAVLCLKGLDRRVGGRPSSDVPSSDAPSSAEVIGGSALDGIRRVLASPYLLGICAFMLLFTIGSTFLYNIQAEIVSRTFSDTTQQTSVFARIDLAVNTLTLVTQLFLTGRLMKWLGVGVTLAILPLISMVGFLAWGRPPSSRSSSCSRCCGAPGTLQSRCRRGSAVHRPAAPRQVQGEELQRHLRLPCWRPGGRVVLRGAGRGGAELGRDGVVDGAGGGGVAGGGVVAGEEASPPSITWVGTRQPPRRVTRA